MSTTPRIMQRIDYALPMYHYGQVEVEVTATNEEIRKAIEADLPKYVTLRVAMGAEDDAEIMSMEFTEEGVCPECEVDGDHAEHCSLHPDNIV